MANIMTPYSLLSVISQNCVWESITSPIKYNQLISHLQIGSILTMLYNLRVKDIDARNFGEEKTQ